MGKGSHAIIGKVGSVSEYSVWRIVMREAEVLISADPRVGMPPDDARGGYPNH
jgi:hypothetical protein